MAALLTYSDTDALSLQAIGDPSGDKWAGQFEGAGTGAAIAPAGTGSTNSQALEFTKAGQAWSGVNLVDFSDTDVRVTDATHTVVTMKYHSTDASPVLMQLIATDSSTTSQCVAAAVGWNTLSFDFTSATGWSADKTYTKVTLFPDFKNGDCANQGSLVAATAVAGQKYYIDNVNFNGYAAPSNSAAPTIGGTAKVGKILTARAGTWTGTSVTTTYKWYACKTKKTAAAASVTSSAKCTVISGATGSTYTLKKAQKGKYIRVLITQTNSLGSATKLSKTYGKVK